MRCSFLNANATMPSKRVKADFMRQYLNNAATMNISENYVQACGIGTGQIHKTLFPEASRFRQPVQLDWDHLEP